MPSAWAQELTFWTRPAARPRLAEPLQLRLRIVVVWPDRRKLLPRFRWRLGISRISAATCWSR